jgi:subtilisin family serine protease
MSVREFVINKVLAKTRVLGFSVEPAYLYDHINAFAIDVPYGAPRKVLRTLSRIPGVQHVGRDLLMKTEEAQPDPPWGLDRIDQRTPVLNQRYNYASTGMGVNVYVVDTGIYVSHNDFGNRTEIAFDAVDDDDNKFTSSNSDRKELRDGLDCNGHGTHVAGTVGGTKYGVAKGVTLLSIRVIGRNDDGKIIGAGCGRYGLLSEILNGINWITGNHFRSGKPSVVNLSIGGKYNVDFNSAVEQSIAAGNVYVVAAGNDNRNLSTNSPASATGVIPVGASEIRGNLDYRWPSSNYGANIIFAPGVAIRSAGYYSEDDEEIKEGTSMAAPHVAGIAARYLENNTNASVAMVRAVIYSNATVGVIVAPGPGSSNLLAYSGFQMEYDTESKMMFGLIAETELVRLLKSFELIKQSSDITSCRVTTESLPSPSLLQTGD